MIPNKLQQAANLIERAQFSEARKLLQSILLKNGAQVDARYLMAVIEASSGNLSLANAELSKVLALRPGHYEAVYTKARVLMDMNQHEEAVTFHDLAVLQRPDNQWAYLNRGNSLAALGHFERALADFTKVTELDPENVMGFCNIANVLRELGDLEKALQNYRNALELEPDYVQALCNLGVVLNELGCHDEALACQERAIALQPDCAEAWTSRGVVLAEMMRLEDSLVSHERAIELQPEYAQAWNNRGVALTDLKRLDEALNSHERAIELSPNFYQACCNRGVVLSDLKRHDDALLSYERAIELNPVYVDAWSNRGVTLKDLKRYEDAAHSYERAFELKPDADYVLGDLIHTRMRVCAWNGLPALLEDLKRQVLAGKAINDPFSLLGLFDDPQLHKQASETYLRAKCRYAKNLGSFYHRPKRDKIRIGYFSADFHDHATMYLMAELFELHDKSKFEVYGFSFGPNVESVMRQRAASAMDKFFDVTHLSDEQIARLSRDCEIDIAIDLKGHTQDARPQVFAHRAAPIQINYLGYPGTIGALADYLIADETLISEASKSWYSEKIIYLPDCYQPNDSGRRLSDRVFTREEVGLPSTGFVFCCFNNSWKILPEVFDLWMEILKAVDESVLWLFIDDQTAMRNLRTEASARQIDPSRLVFAQTMKHEEHLARYRLADLFLDTLPYNAHTTASDALWSGIPVLTHEGKSFAARVASSLLRNMGLPELIVQTPEEYLETAIGIALDPVKLQAIKAKVSSNRTVAPLFNTRLYTRHLEQAYELAYARLHSDLAPDHIHVARSRDT